MIYRFFLTYFLLSLIILFAGSCDPQSFIEEIESRESVKIDIAFIYPSLQYREKYEPMLIEQIEIANEKYKDTNIEFVWKESHINASYNTNFVHTLGNEIYLSSYYSGVIPIYIVDSIGEIYDGYGLDTTICRKSILIKSNEKLHQNVVSHELGHVLGLGHSNDANNVMHHFLLDKSNSFTDEQIKKINNAGENYYLHCKIGLFT